MLIILLLALMAVTATVNGDDTFPPYRTSKGFRLVIHVTDPARHSAMGESEHGREVGAFHISSIFNVATGYPPDKGDIFFQASKPSEAGSTDSKYKDSTITVKGAPGRKFLT